MDSSYGDIFLNSAYAYGSIYSFIALFFLFLSRMLPIISLAPFFGAKILPQPIKVCFAISLFAIFFPHLMLISSKAVDFSLLLVFLCAKEVFIGFIIGFIISMPFNIVISSGMYIDHQQGGASLMIHDPTMQNQSSPLGTLFNYLLICIFFWFDIPILLLDALFDSYNIVPPDQFFNTDLLSFHSHLGKSIIDLTATIIKIAVKLASPALLAILMTDVFLGLANRLAPQVQITFLGLPLKSLISIIVIFLGWKLFGEAFAAEGRNWLHFVYTLIGYFR